MLNNCNEDWAKDVDNRRFGTRYVFWWIGSYFMNCKKQPIIIRLNLDTKYMPINYCAVGIPYKAIFKRH